MTHIILNGRGNMALVMEKMCEAENAQVSRWDPSNAQDLEQVVTPATIAVTFSKTQERFNAFVRWCEMMKVPIISGSRDVVMPTRTSVPIIDAPNLALKVIKALKEWPDEFGPRVRAAEEVWIVEFHQESKGKGQSATALALAQALGIGSCQIRSVRDPALQLLLGIPVEYLEGHAYHFLIIRHKNGGVQIEPIKIDGRDQYAYDAIQLAQFMESNRETLQPGIVTIGEMVDRMKAA